MPCICTTGTLRFFVRIVAQLDLSASTICRTTRRTHSHAFCNITARPARSSLSFSNRPGSFSSSTAASVDDFAPVEGEPPKSRRSLTTSRSLCNDGGSSDPSSRASPLAESAFIDLSPESVDELAAELVHRTSFEKAASVADLVPKATLRRRKVQNTRPDSAPRASLRRPAKATFRPEYRSNSTSDVPRTRRLATKDEWTPPKREPWQVQKAVLKEKFPEGWNPLKRLSPDALAGIRALHAQMPEQYTTSALAASFQVSPEAIRKILKTKWTPNSEEEIDRRRRWAKRGEKVWSRYSELGVKPPSKWRAMGIGRGKPVRNPRKPTLVTTARASDHRFGNGTESDSLADRLL